MRVTGHGDRRPTGTIEEESDYHTWGEESVITHTLADQHYKFNGKERDPETGFDEFGARLYNSAWGRWLIPDWSADPTPVPYAQMDNPQSLNLYAYVLNNPTTLPDLDGHFAGLLNPSPESLSQGDEHPQEDEVQQKIDQAKQELAAMGAKIAEASQGPAMQQTAPKDKDKATVSVSTDIYTNQANDRGYAGAQIQLTATVKGDDNVAYNWQQTVTQSDSVNGQKPNVPFNDASPDTHMYWSASEQKKAMDAAAKQGATTIFADAPQRFGGVPFTFHAKTSLIGIGKDGTRKVLWTATWGVKVTAKGSTLEPLKVLIP